MNNARFIFAAATVASACAFSPASAADTFSLDPAHTQTVFEVSHLGYSTITGNFHDLKGSVVLDQEKPNNSHVEVEIGTATVDTGFAARDNDLRSQSFFNVAAFPTMTFKSTSVRRTGPKTADVKGDLTLLGVTKPEVLKVVLNRIAPDQLRNNATVAGFTGTTMIKRSDFGMKAYLPYIGDDVKVTINFEGIKQ
jgi:polyisoprenoid-binding protein YceI